MYNKFGEKVIPVNVLIRILQDLPEGMFVRCNLSNDLVIQDDIDIGYLGYVHMGNHYVQWLSDNE